MSVEKTLSVERKSQIKATDHRGATRHYLLRASLWALTLLFSLHGLARAATVEGVRLWRAPDNTRVVFDLSGPVEHNLFMLSNPSRLVVDIPDTALNTGVDHLPLGNTPISAIRTGRREQNTLRVVFDLRAGVDPQSFVLAKHGDKSDRLVLDLNDLNAAATPEPTIVDPVSNAKRDIIIAVDAGHGGEDPGAVGPGRIYEKNVVLEISRQLARMIDDHPGYKAEMIRTGDYYIPLKQRPAKARQKRADLFISIHADAFRHASAHGASVYALNARGARATSETARYLAQQENDADLIGGVGNVSLRDKDEALAEVLVDLSMTHTLSSSLELGDQVLRSLDGMTRLHKRQVEQANFAVLRSADLPSLLVETGFISNPAEAKKLGSASYRKQIAQKIFDGVRNYFTRSPPPGTYLAWAKNNSGWDEHVIMRGDTLSDIAERYNVSVSEILTANGMSSTVIRVGQRLKIPTS